MTADLAYELVSDAELRELRRRYEAGALVHDLAHEYGLTLAELRAALKRTGAAHPHVHPAVAGKPSSRRETPYPVVPLARGGGSTAPGARTRDGAAEPRKRTDHPRRAAAPAPPAQKDVQLRTAYEAGATMRELAAAHDMTSGAVQSALKRAGTVMRPRGPRQGPARGPAGRGGGGQRSAHRHAAINDAAQLRELYVDRGWTIARIARHYRCSPQTVDAALARFGISKRQRKPYTRSTQTPPGDAVLRREYEAGATMMELAAAHDMSYNAVRSALQRAGTEMRSAGSRRGHATRRGHVIDDAAQLRELYVERGLSIKQVAEHYGRSVNAVRGALRRFGIPARRPWDWKRSQTTREVFTQEHAEHLRELYTQRRWSIARIAAHHGCGIAAVRSALHRFDIVAPRYDPVLGAQLRAAYEAGATLDRLAAAHGLSRATVRTALRHAGATIRKPGGNRWGRSRTELQTWDAQLRTEYLAGASVRQLAAAHGYSDNAIRRGLARAGTPMRAPSPSRSAPRTPQQRAPEPPEPTPLPAATDTPGEPTRTTAARNATATRQKGGSARSVRSR